MKIISLFFSLTVMTWGSSWSSYLGPNGNGTAEGKIPANIQKDGPKVLWKAEVGIGCSSFTIADGRAYTVGNKDDRDTLWCFDAKTGDVVWKKDYSEKLAAKFYDGGPGATPIVDEGLVYNLSKSGRLSCYDAKGGDEKWVVEFKDDLSGNMPTWGYSSSPVVYGEVLLCLPCSKKGAMVALNKKTGKTVWSSSNGARPGYAAPVLYKNKGKDAAVVFHGRSVVGYGLSTKGKVLFEYDWRTPYDVNASNPQILGDLVHISSGYNMGYAVLDVSKPKPEIVHRNRDLPMIFQNCYLEGDDLVGCFGDKRYNTELYRMDFKSGDILWKHPLPGTRGSTAKIGETTVVLTETGMVVFGTAGEKSFTETGRHQVLKKLCWAPIAIGEGKLFARTNKGEVVCLDLTTSSKGKSGASLAPPSKANEKAARLARSYMNGLSKMIESYREFGGIYPSEAQGLASLYKRPRTSPRPRNWVQALNKPVSKDPWTTPYKYTYPGSIDSAKPEICSAGPDRKFGTADDISIQAK